MSNIPPTLAYATPGIGNCPLCQTRPVSKKKIYGHPVCKKCFYKFANRRQLDYLVDALLFTVPNVVFILLLSYWLTKNGIKDFANTAIIGVTGALLGCVFCLRDGIGGRSPGKRLTNLVVLDEADRQPISFGQSFKRNAILLVGYIPFVGSIAALIVIIILVIQVGSGYRLGDRFANTRVIWKRYADSPVFGGDALVCTNCGYDVRGNTSGICPECGKAISPELQAKVIAN